MQLLNGEPLEGVLLKSPLLMNSSVSVLLLTLVKDNICSLVTTETYLSSPAQTDGTNA